jgi:hypothetical protein
MSLMQFYNIRFLANLLFFNIFFFDKHDLHVSEFSDQLLTTVYSSVAAVHRVRGGALPYAARVARLWAARLWAAATHRVPLLCPERPVSP